MLSMMNYINEIIEDERNRNEEFDAICKLNEEREAIEKAIDVLEEAGIRTNIMFTVSRANFKQLIPLINYVGKTNKTDFSFARYCTAKQDDMLDMLSSEEYRTLLLRVVEAFRFWKQERHSIVQWDLAKDSLYAPLYEDMGINFYEIKSGCCLLGNGKSIAMLPSGHIFYCRRMPKEIGQYYSKRK